MSKSFREIIDSWPGKKPGLASDLNVKVETVKGWSKRDAIPDGYWAAMIAKDRERGLGLVTADLLVSLAALRVDDCQAA